MTAALQGCYEVLYAHLVLASPLWAERVEPLTVASATQGKPYVVFFNAGGGRELQVPSRNHQRFVIAVKGVAYDMGTALAMQGEISAQLHNAGEQDINPRLPVHPLWHVLTVTEGRAIWIEEQFAGVQNIYHAGYQYEILMEAK